MSLNDSLTKAVDSIIHSFIEQIASKYNIEASELLFIWEGNSTESKNISSKSFITDIPQANDELDYNVLLKCKKPEIQALCRQRNLKIKGTKEELIALLVGKNNDTIPKTSQTEKKPKKPTKQETEIPTVIKKLTSNITTVAIRRNQFGHHEHPETSLVFDTKSKKVIGKQNDDGTIADLTPEDINTCNQYKFTFVRPDNLENKKNDEVTIDELDDDIIEDSDEDIDEEELIEDEDEDFNDIEEETGIDDEDFD